MFSSIAAGTNHGEIWTILHPFMQEGVNRLLVHRGPVTRLAQTADQSILFSAGEDGSLFIFKVSEELNTDLVIDDLKRLTTKLTEDDIDIENAHIKVMDRELANIVLVKKHEMEKWLQRQDKLQYDLGSTKRKVDSKLAECRKRYDMQF